MAPGTARLDHAEQLLEELEQVEERLRWLQGEVARQHRLATLGTMAAAIAHEFNNILTPMISYCQLALRNGGEDGRLMHKAVTKALAGAERAARISASVLGFARDDDGSQSCQVQAVVDETLSCLAREPAKDGIELSQDIDDDCWVGMSPVWLQQVLVNLVLNAREAMRGRGGRLVVRCKAIGAEVLVEVSDSGPGIPKEIEARLFEPFVSKRDESGATVRGTGLGLAVCRQLVQQAGGQISVESEPGCGATFRIQLPRAEGEGQSV